MDTKTVVSCIYSIRQKTRGQLVCLITCLAVAHASVAQHKTKWQKPLATSPVFIENVGQFNLTDSIPTVQFSGNGRGVWYDISKNGFSLRYTLRDAIDKTEPWENEEHKPREQFVLRAEFIGSNQEARVEAKEKASHYFTFAKDRKSLRAEAYQTVWVYDLYKGIDMYYHLPKEGGLKYGFVVHPGADPDDIIVQWKGADGIELGSTGNVLLDTRVGQITDAAPNAFQGGANPEAVHIQYMVHNNQVKFLTDQYNENEELIIDPWVNSMVSQSPWWGTVRGQHVKTDDSGNIYVFIIDNGWPTTNRLVRKYDMNGNLLWTHVGQYGLTWTGSIDIS